MIDAVKLNQELSAIFNCPLATDKLHLSVEKETHDKWSLYFTSQYLPKELIYALLRSAFDFAGKSRLFRINIQELQGTPRVTIKVNADIMRYRELEKMTDLLSFPLNKLGNDHFIENIVKEGDINAYHHQGKQLPYHQWVEILGATERD